MQAVHGVHHALEFRTIQQIERPLFSRKHLQRDSLRRRHHPGRFFRRQVTGSDRFNRQLDENSQAANPAAFVVNLLLRGSRANFGLVGCFSRLWHLAK